MIELLCTNNRRFHYGLKLRIAGNLHFIPCKISFKKLLTDSFTGSVQLLVKSNCFFDQFIHSHSVHCKISKMLCIAYNTDTPIVLR